MWGEDWGWLQGDSLKGLQCSAAATKGVLGGRLGPTSEARFHCWGYGRGEAGATISASFPAHMLSSNRTLPTQAPGLCESHCCNLGQGHHCH